MTRSPPAGHEVSLVPARSRSPAPWSSLADSNTRTLATLWPTSAQEAHKRRGVRQTLKSVLTDRSPAAACHRVFLNRDSPLSPQRASPPKSGAPKKRACRPRHLVAGDLENYKRPFHATRCVADTWGTHLYCHPSVTWGRASALQIALASRPEGLPHMTTQVNRGFIATPRGAGVLARAPARPPEARSC